MGRRVMACGRVVEIRDIDPFFDGREGGFRQGCRVLAGRRLRLARGTTPIREAGHSNSAGPGRTWATTAGVAPPVQLRQRPRPASKDQSYAARPDSALALIRTSLTARCVKTMTATSSSAFPVFVQGLALSLGLIVASGARSAFVLRQGASPCACGQRGAVLRGGGCPPHYRGCPWQGPRPGAQARPGTCPGVGRRRLPCGYRLRCRITTMR